MFMVITIVETTFVVWLCLFIVMLPVYLIRRKINPMNEKNTIKDLLIKSFIASLICSLILCSGLIAMYIDEQKGIYR